MAPKVAGSNLAARPTNHLMASSSNRSGHRPFKAATRVRTPLRLPISHLLFGGIVYRLGRQPLTLESWVRFPVPLPTRSQSPRSSASGAGRLFLSRDMKESIIIRVFGKIRMSDANSRTISCVISHHYFVQITKLLEMNYCMASMPRYVAGG